MKKLELLAPAGDMEKLKAAVVYGADAVYLGGKQFGLRMGATNFDEEALEQAVEFAHSWGVKVYVTVNIFARNRDLGVLPRYLQLLQYLEVDGIIVADPGVFAMVRREIPDMPIHVSTQANITNKEAAAFWEKQGADRLVLARELSLWEMREIRGAVSLDLEAFVHGAMCISYSGRCLLSSYMAGRDANQGDCAQPCRWRYVLEEEKRPGQYFPVYEDEQGTFILSSKDLCLLHYLPDLIRAGVSSFKIEGRVKGVHYVASVIKVFRQALDRYLANPTNYTVDPAWWDELGKVSNRQYTTGFIHGPVVEIGQRSVEKIYNRPYAFVGMVMDYDVHTCMAKVQQRNHFKVGETMEIVEPYASREGRFTIETMYDEERKPIDTAPHPCQTVWLPVPYPVAPYSLLRRKEGTTEIDVLE